MNALAAEECTPDEFVGEIIRLQQEDEEIGWEALALLDQQFRRAKISQDVFIKVKSQLQQHAVSSLAGVPHPEPVALAAPAAPIPTVLPAQVAPPAAPPLPSPVAPTASAAVHRQVRMGDQLGGRYRVVDILRSDATGTLVEALDETKVRLTGIRTRVAIQLLDDPGPRAPDLLQRLGKLQRLSHPAIVRLLDVEEHGGELLLVMELVNGVPLQDLIARKAGKAMDVTLALNAVRTVAGALAYAHLQGVTHGAVDAGNVLVNHTGEVFLQNFQLEGDQTSNVAADRLAFAWLAYELLTGTAATERANNRSSRLRAPPVLSREKWRVLRDTLTGKDGSDGDVLAAFAGEDSRTVKTAPASQLNGAPPTVGRRSRAWIAGALVTAGLLFAIFFYPTEERRETSVTREAPIASLPPTVTREAPIASLAPAVPPATTSPPAEKVIINAEPAQATQRPNVPAPTSPGRATIDLPADVMWVESTAPVARIWVRRRGNLNGTVSFQWWTESGSALPDRDFRRISARVAVIPSGAKGTELLVPMMPDAERAEPRTFYVKIDSPSARATLGAKTLMQVAIVPPRFSARVSGR
ncbi:MAG: protein kinase [Steroidobacteraceae bacterium]